MPNADAVSKNKDEMAYYAMSMPDWFIKLPYEKKIELAKKFSKNSPSDEVMSSDDVLNLLSGSQCK